MSMVVWERDDENQGFSLARWERRLDGWLFHGNELLVGEPTLSCAFSVEVATDWTTRRVRVRAVAAAAATERRLDSDGHHWLVDGRPRPDLDGCLDVDVAATPLTNTFPIRRLGELPVGASVQLAVAWVDVPELGVTRVEQTYERLADEGGRRRWRYSDRAHGAFTLTVDDDGIVVDYEGFARRIDGPPRTLG